jgi:hypothetical protein
MSFNESSSMSNISYSPTVDGMPQTKPDSNAKIPEGLIMPPSPIIEENKVDESKGMADFSTPIEELVTPGPSQMIQDEMMGPASMPMQAKRASRSEGGSDRKSNNPMGMTDEQYTAVIAGLCGLAAFSKPIQEKLIDMIPSMIKDGTDTLSATGMAIMAAVVALLFYFAKRALIAK